MGKLSLYEFLSTLEDDDGKPNKKWEEHWRKHLPAILASDKDTARHAGDCTKSPGTCVLCFVEDALRQYREYFFDEQSAENTPSHNESMKGNK